MRNYVVIKGLALIIIMYMLYGCQSRGVNAPELLLAERIMEEHPDSALRILKQIPDSFYTHGEEQALYGLLLTEAMDKTYAVHTTDSLIAIAAQYYERTKDLNHKAKAWYYWGRVSQDLLRSEKAIECYLKAIPSTEKLRNYQLLALIYNHSGNLYRQQRVCDKALSDISKAYKYFVVAEDTSNIPYVLRDIGRTYSFWNKPDSALVYYSKALESADMYDNRIAKGTILHDLGTTYRQMGDYSNAIRLIKKSLPYRMGNDIQRCYLSLARIYCDEGILDSTHYYIDKIQKCDDIQIQKSVAYFNYEICVNRGEYEKAIYYNEKYQKLKNIISQDQQNIKVLNLEYQYKQERLKQAMELKASKERFLYICLILLLLISIMIGGYVYQRNRLLHEQMLRLQEKKIQKEKELRMQSIEQLRQNIYQIEINKQKLASQAEDLQAAQRSLIVYDTKLLKAENELIALKREERDFRNKLFYQTGFPDRIKSAGIDTHKKDIPQPPFSMKEYPTLVEKLNELYNDFTIRLQKAYPLLKERDIAICCLLKAGAKTGNVASIVSMTPNAVTKKKKQILEKMEIWDKDASLEDFVMNFW